MASHTPSHGETCRLCATLDCECKPAVSYCIHGKPFPCASFYLDVQLRFALCFQHVPCICVDPHAVLCLCRASDKQLAKTPAAAFHPQPPAGMTSSPSSMSNVIRCKPRMARMQSLHRLLLGSNVQEHNMWIAAC